MLEMLFRITSKHNLSVFIFYLLVVFDCFYFLMIDLKNKVFYIQITSNIYLKI